jgi:hypothetical protein
LKCDTDTLPVKPNTRTKLFGKSFQEFPSARKPLLMPATVGTLTLHSIGWVWVRLRPKPTVCVPTPCAL